jgi:hypothetical protein
MMTKEQKRRKPMKNRRTESNRTWKQMFSLYVLLIAMAVLVLAATAPDSWAWGRHHWRPEVSEFDEFEVFIEINATDLDAGLQGKLDGEAWNYASVRGPNGQSIFRFNPNGSLEEHGVTEIQWESNEPPFEPSEEAEEGYTLDTFLDLFPEGRYKAWGRTVEGDYLRGMTMLTHNLPAGPVVEVEQNSLLTVTWEKVTDQFHPEHPQGHNPPDEDLESEIVAYIVVAEYTLTDGEEEITRALSIDVAADVFSAVIPGDFLPADQEGGFELEEFKIEVGGVEESGNLTFTEIKICLDAGVLVDCPPDDDE